MRAVGVPVETEQFKRYFLQEGANRESAKLVRALIPMENAQASFQVLRLSPDSRLSHFLRLVPPSITHQASVFVGIKALRVGLGWGKIGGGGDPLGPWISGGAHTMVITSLSGQGPVRRLLGLIFSYPLTD